MDTIVPRTDQLAALLAPHFTAFHYDRRGRAVLAARIYWPPTTVAPADSSLVRLLCRLGGVI